MGPAFLELMQLKAQDAMFLARGQVPPASDAVVVVSIDERSLDEEGRWPWPRSKMARLIRAIGARGAKCIGLDIGFFEPDDRLPVQALLELAQQAQAGKPLDLEAVITRHHPDYLLAKAIAESPADVILGYFFYLNPREVSFLNTKEVALRRRQMSKFAFRLVRYQSERALEAPVTRVYAPELNQPILIAASSWAGYYNVWPDMDGAVRRLNLVVRCGEQFYPSLALATLCRFLGRKLPRLEVDDNGLEPIRVGKLTIPVDPSGQMWVNFLGGSRALPVVEASDILRGRKLPHSLKGKAVLVNVSAIGVQDRRPTPFNRQLPGALIHAQALDNMLSGRFLVRSPLMALGDLGAVLLLCLGGGLLLGLRRPLLGAGLTLLLGLGYVLFAFGLFVSGYLVNLVYPLGALILTAIALTTYRYLSEEREKRQIKKTFQHYLSPEVIETLLKDPSQLKLGGKRMELSVLFVDIRGFTTLSEQLSPEDLASLLNAFTDGMTQVILDTGGLVDKYIGDSVMAVFGAPVQQPDHAARACRAALGMVQEVRRLNRELPLPEGVDLRVGVGVNSGPMVVGNMGSRLRFNYTVVGDNVNLASRLEGQTKEYGVEVVISQSTREQVGDDEFLVRVLDVIRVKGKRLPVTIYELLGPRPPETPRHLSLYQQAFDAYLERDFGRAVELLEEAAELAPEDGPTRVLLARARDYLRQPPPEDWDGVVTKTSK